MVCVQCDETFGRPRAEVWRRLAHYLHGTWAETVKRGQFDLTKVFGPAAAASATSVHLHFIQVLGSQLARQGVAVNLESFAEALKTGGTQPEITLLVANSGHPGNSLWSYDTDVSVLRDGPLVISALWMQLEHPIAIKICYVKSGAALQPPLGAYPWHPTKQKKIVKISPYKGAVQPLLARRDLRI